ncbi:sulfurtransferase complex subunit TusB [Oceanotoga teriensis]|jgi:tRNA 2-thiouridine synthesizing protein B|uniref:tRNA 2-thiouridine synthesizing protein B n=1 Tax=Oceanotoga teriensis TaxID=515440 RepID=A0AA45HIP9_9BACT|nr:sulfurtransferase complex subunit TusB [Oceanotoga teriensis]MDO7977069.1 sulfurtransferase complex subunit TusB [Oceanotoga teriensis]PWJ92185.1 tRNA 2-thiouridine synthesizing protein B [Oceanotoga teriensis]
MALVLVKHGLDNPAAKILISNTKSDDSVVFIQNGAFWARDEKVNEIKGKKYVLKDDFLSRGYDESTSKVDLIDYSEFVDILEKEEKTIG